LPATAEPSNIDGVTARRLKPGESFRSRDLQTTSGVAVAVPDPDRTVHLQLRRFAGCPICNLHLCSMSERRGEIAGAGIREVVVFHSSAEELRRYEDDLPFALVADPDRRLYRELGVEPSPRALLHPRAWVAMVVGPVRSLIAFARRREPLPPLHPRGGRLGLPADFLIGADGRIRAVKYGDHAYDQWSVDDLLALKAAARA
jgi:peroxiredoxin